ncbi:MAG: hypothetical protein HXS51_12400, partial [Theionarchaea archaeon]|nr:hypothetical protein [Theionarchaea archaeon]
MLKRSLIIAVVLVSMVAGTSSFFDSEGRKDSLSEQVFYQIPQRGIQDFSDGD